MKKKTSKKTATKAKASTKKAAVAPVKKERKIKRASKKILSAASHIQKATKKMVDDVFLKVVGLRVLERAQEMTKSLHKEKSASKRKGRAK